jgi:hypothetical protein
MSVIYAQQSSDCVTQVDSSLYLSGNCSTSLEAACSFDCAVGLSDFLSAVSKKCGEQEALNFRFSNCPKCAPGYNVDPTKYLSGKCISSLENACSMECDSSFSKYLDAVKDRCGNDFVAENLASCKYCV